MIYWLVFCENTIDGNLSKFTGNNIWKRIMEFDYTFCILKMENWTENGEIGNIRGKLVILSSLH